ncbi:AAA family ATPase [Mesorhizobium sp. M0808]|uniref:trifunctional serine/threonine-protein kinase/ATP-binding protein/sensor histidine kinase n=1 Tax=Mesorhizobium sp. M0808 TaxID=2957002 RepID=UPI003339843B
MSTYSGFNGSEKDLPLEMLWEDGERVFCRTCYADEGSQQYPRHSAQAGSEPAASRSGDILAHEYGLKDYLDSAWALRPLKLLHKSGRTALTLEFPGGEPLDRALGVPMEVGKFLGLAIATSVALRGLHEHGLIHKDIKPSNIVVDLTIGKAWLTGFGIASRLRRERQSPEPPEFIAGTLAYMAPEQTGRMNRSIDSRSDIYSLGIVLYEALTGSLPFAATDPMGWVHCHLARTPASPNERGIATPNQISAILMKLLAKVPEERYQTAAGLETDFRRCLVEWKARRAIAAFPLCERDTSDQLVVPEKLYGRETEVETLLRSFDRIATEGTSELLLVSGYAGIGKSSVINELHKILVLPRGLFATGKFDQYKRDIPYATLAQALQSLIRPLLSRPEAELATWRDQFHQTLGSNGALVIDLVPELKFIIGEQPPVPDLPPYEAKARFQVVFRQFINVFARPEHPLALFLDDLQWLDLATLDLIEDLLTQSDVRHLLLIGAYRDNEVGRDHPLMRKLESIRKCGASVREIDLGPLASKDWARLVADALRCKAKAAAPLAALIHEKTAGNPFFAIQFIYALVEEDLLAFSHDKSAWRWDLDRIAVKGHTDNVVDLMVARLSRLPTETQRALQGLACVGNSADAATLLTVLEHEVIADLWEALRVELIVHSNGSYKFVHDRVHEAAYSLIPEASRAEAHLGIGRRLAARMPVERREEAIFEIVNQLNRGAALITSINEREQLAEFNLIAGKRAQTSTAYASALNYLEIGAALLTDDCWQRRHDLVFSIELARAQCEFVSGAVDQAEKRLSALSGRATTTIEQATVACLRVDLYMSIDRSDYAVSVGLEALRKVGIEWSPRPTEEEAYSEYQGIWVLLGDRTIEQLTDSPLMTDPISLATLDLLVRVAVPAFFVSSHLFAVAVCRAVSLSLQHGNSDASCIAYELFAMLAGPHFGNYDAGYRIGRLGCELVERPELQRFQARTYETFGFVIPWTQHVRAGRDLLTRSFEIASRTGDITYSGYACGQITTNFLLAGDPLVEAQKEAEIGLEFAVRVRFGLIVGWITGQLRLIRMLRGLTDTFGSFDEAGFNELAFEGDLARNPALALPECWYWIRKLQARYLSGDCQGALNASTRAEPMLWASLSLLETVEYHFYDALSHAAACDLGMAEAREAHLEKLAAHHRKFEVWARNGPENFENRLALLSAEMARIEGRELDAERHYERAIESAHAGGFVHNEALASELAARFYAARGFQKIGDLYLRDARRGYQRWGADGKVRQLEHLYPRLREESTSSDAVSTSTILAPVERLDLATVIKVSQAVSGELVLEKLLDTLMRTALEYAGATRGLLIVSRDDEYRIEAEATTSSDAVKVELRQVRVTGEDLPESVFHYVLRTKDTVLLNDASAANPLAQDAYIRKHRVRSILCIPLLKQTGLLGVLYLENNLAQQAFTPAAVAILKLLVSEAAIALENTQLYRDLQEREAKIRRLVDSNIIGIFFWDVDGRIIDANEAFLRIVGHDRQDLAAGRLSWKELTPLEWLAGDERRLAGVLATGAVEPYEKEFFTKAGARVPVLIGAAILDGPRNEGVAFVLDLTERTRAEEAARESDRRYHEIQLDLVHANRVATLGHLSASVAHEVNQPITGIVINAQTALRMLDRPSPDVGEIRKALARVVRDGHRTGEVVSRIRALAKKTPPQKEELDINEAILEVTALTQGAVARNEVSVQTQLAGDLPPVNGDRIQLQQVVLNLILNAVDAMKTTALGSREILISTTNAESTDVLVAVRDSGIGVEDSDHERIFDAFYSNKPDGLGLGLSICRSIIEAHGGKLWVTSEAGQGATFQFTLPTSQPPSAADAA